MADALDPDGKVVCAVKDPVSTEGGLAVLRGTLAPNGAVIKITGLESVRFEGRARVFGREEDCMAAVTSGEIAKGEVVVIRYEGTKGVLGCGRCWG